MVLHSETLGSYQCDVSYHNNHLLRLNNVQALGSTLIRSLPSQILFSVPS